MTTGYRFVIELLEEDAPDERVPVLEPDFAPVRECLRLLAIRRGRLPPVSRGPERLRVAPLWDETSGPPHVRALEASLEGVAAAGSESCIAREVPLTVFRADARRGAAALLAEKKLPSERGLRYRVLAFPADLPASGAASGFVVKELEEPLPLRDGSLESFLDASTAAGEERDDADLAAFFPRAVLDEAEELKTAAGAVETGGILLGYLRRDPSSRELFVEVTALVPAPAQGEAMRLTFTPETWSAVRQALDLRRRGELVLGFFHSHPAKAWCRDCDPARWARCPLARPFFSDEDRHLQRTVFPRAYHLALVAGDRFPDGGEWEPYHALFGWRDGVVVERSFHVLASAETQTLSSAG